MSAGVSEAYLATADRALVEAERNVPGFLFTDEAEALSEQLDRAHLRLDAISARLDRATVVTRDSEQSQPLSASVREPGKPCEHGLVHVNDGCERA